MSRKTETVVLAGRDFVVRRIPMARVSRLGTTLSAIVEDLTKLDLQDNQNATEVIFNKVLEFPHELLSLFIKDLPEDIFKDEEEGVDFPEFLDALNTAIELNRIDTLKNFFSRLAPLMMQASTLQKAN